MQSYTVKVFTSNRLSNTVKWLSVQLVGKNGKSSWTWFAGMRGLFSGGEATVTVTSPESLGDLVAVELQKNQLPLTFESQWFVEKVEVTSPEKEVFKFPIYHWIKRTKVYSFCEGKALRASDEQHSSVSYKREMELERRAQKYRWTEYKKSLPYCMTGGILSLPSEVWFSITKFSEFAISAAPQKVRTSVFNLFKSEESWKSFGDIYQAMIKDTISPVTEYVYQHWTEDPFFGYQYLNGVNPIKIRRCTSLPSNFPVTDDMVTLEGNMKLSDEIKNENIFICDYKTLDAVETGKVGGEAKYLLAPLVLFHKTPADELKPVAIQLKQTPSKDNPIFLPTDSEDDWLLAKTYVRGADFSEHQLNTHLLRTHLLSEVFSVALMRNIPKVHPLYKLLIPHTRYTLQINMLARELLISEKGVFPTFAATTAGGMTTILKRSMSGVTYKSLCIKDDITERGMGSMPNYYYMEDGTRLWDIIEKFVKGVLSEYYARDGADADAEVKGDPELQNYIQDIFEHGFLFKETSGIPQSFESLAELVKFVTMVIFTGSAQHAAVNNGQSDFASWMPNTPTALMQPPPTTKGGATRETLLQTLPGRTVTNNAVSVLRLLSTPSTDFVALGQFPHENFTETAPCRLMEDFYNELLELNEKIDRRNETLPLPYIYLKPPLMENSVSI